MKAKVKEFKDTYPQRKGIQLKGDLLHNKTGVNKDGIQVVKSNRGFESDDEDDKKKKKMIETGGDGEDEPDKDSKYYGRKDCIKL